MVDLDALAAPGAAPKLLVSATNVEAGQIAYFDSGDHGLSLDHILASGSLPPSFPMTVIGGKSYWDGGLFDNTPLGAVLDKLGGGRDDPRTVYVVNLFPNKAPIPHSMAEVAERMQNLQFANKTAEDLRLMERFNEVAALMKVLDDLPGGNPIKDTPAFKAIEQRGYVCVPRIVSITRPQQVSGFDGSDFSPEAIKMRAAEGYAQTELALKARGFAP